MKEKIILKVKDILNTDILHDPDLGHTLFLVVSEYLNEANKIVLDFKDIKFVNNAFFNNSIGKLLLLDNFDIKNNNLVFLNMSETGLELLRETVLSAQDKRKKDMLRKEENK